MISLKRLFKREEKVSAKEAVNAAHKVLSIIRNSQQFVSSVQYEELRKRFVGSDKELGAGLGLLNSCSGFKYGGGNSALLFDRSSFGCARCMHRKKNPQGMWICEVRNCLIDWLPTRLQCPNGMPSDLNDRLNGVVVND